MAKCRHNDIHGVCINIYIYVCMHVRMDACMHACMYVLFILNNTIKLFT